MSGLPVLSLSAEDVDSLLDLAAAMASQRAAFVGLAGGKVDLPAKIMHASRFDDSVVFGYLARVSAGTGAVAKIGSVNPGNAAEGLPTVSALVVALDPATGRPVAVLDGTAVTTIRTAAASAVAVGALALPDANSLALLGSGVQARAHARAINRVRPLDSIALWSPTPRHRERAAADLTAELGVAVRVAATPQEAVRGMRIVATCTLSRTPVVRGTWLAEGCTVISIGSFEPDRREVDLEVIRRAEAVVVDHPGTAVQHAGPVVAALREKLLNERDLVALGDVLTGDRAVRTDGPGVVFYNSVGLGVQDAAAAWAVIEAARAAGRR